MFALCWQGLTHPGAGAQAGRGKGREGGEGEGGGGEGGVGGRGPKIYKLANNCRNKSIGPYLLPWTAPVNDRTAKDRPIVPGRMENL